MDPAFSLDAVVEDIVPAPPKVVIYGAHGVGKTTFGAGFPNAILLMTEAGVGSLRIRRFPKVVETYHDFMTAIGALYQGEHDRQTLLLDSLDWLEPIVWQETAQRHNKDSIESWDYGKGYIEAEKVWSEVLTGLDALQAERGMSIVCTAHAAVTRFQSPTVEPYDRYSIKLHKRASALVQEWADIVGFAHWQTVTTATDLGFNKKAVRGVSTGQRLLALEERPAWEAKNRFQMPPVMPLDAAQFLALLAERYTPAPVIEAAPSLATQE
ncbi:MAG: ATP-binding protein [Gemmatimonadaceae bacterium]|nr:ATP-binding protein [Gemmatimonadaceae bacterium]